LSADGRLKNIANCDNNILQFAIFMLPLIQQNDKDMTTQEFKNIAISKLNALSTSDLIMEIKKLANNLSDGADLISDAALEILMNRLPEKEFIELCETL
jgi:hypothetical protein